MHAKMMMMILMILMHHVLERSFVAFDLLVYHYYHISVFSLYWYLDHQHCPLGIDEMIFSLAFWTIESIEKKKREKKKGDYILVLFRLMQHRIDGIEGNGDENIRCSCQHMMKNKNETNDMHPQGK
jgi:hypothetical protein